MSYLGNTPTTQSFISGTDYFNGNGSTTAFTLSRTVASVNDIQAVVNNVVQVPNDAYNISGTTITFTSAPSSGTGNVYVRYMSTTTQSITPSQNTVSYSTLNTDLQSGGYASNFKNRIINGAMVIDQRNAGAAVTVNAQAIFYTVDRFRAVGQPTSGVFTVQRISDAPSGFVNSTRVTVTTADSSIGASDRYFFQQVIEGNNVADLGFGTASASAVTISFWVKSSLTGTFGGCLQNEDTNRSYPFNYTINAANTWEYKTVTIAGDTTGTWATNNNGWGRLNWSLGSGSTFTSTANSWQAANYEGVTGQVQPISTLNATWQITGVQLEKGSTATSFDYIPYGNELQLCQRYCQVLGGAFNGSIANIQYGVGNSSSTTLGYVLVSFLVSMRSSPSATYLNPTNFYLDAPGAVSLTSMSTDIASPVNSSIACNTASGQTIGRGVRLFQNGSNATQITYSAEL